MSELLGKGRKEILKELISQCHLVSFRCKTQ
jgi:hypothetical protein